MRHSIPVRFLLIFALLFAQTGGLTHGISHIMEDASQHKTLTHDKLCNLCAAYAQIGSAMGSHIISFTPVEQLAIIIAIPFNTLVSNDTFAAFSARAPPYSV